MKPRKAPPAPSPAPAPLPTTDEPPRTPAKHKSPPSPPSLQKSLPTKWKIEAALTAIQDAHCIAEKLGRVAQDVYVHVHHINACLQDDHLAAVDDRGADQRAKLVARSERISELLRMCELGSYALEVLSYTDAARHRIP